MRVYCPLGKETFDGATTETAPPEEIVAELRYADAMLNTGKDCAGVFQAALEASESTFES